MTEPLEPQSVAPAPEDQDSRIEEAGEKCRGVPGEQPRRFADIGWPAWVDRRRTGDGPRGRAWDTPIGPRHEPVARALVGLLARQAQRLLEPAPRSPRPYQVPKGSLDHLTPGELSWVVHRARKGDLRPEDLHGSAHRTGRFTRDPTTPRQPSCGDLVPPDSRVDRSGSSEQTLEQ